VIVLAAGIDLPSALRSVLHDGAAHVPGALDGDFVGRLHTEVEDGPFELAPEVVGPVRQRTETYTLASPFRGALRSLAVALGREVRASGLRGLGTWRPNEAAVQRYEPGLVGITPHRDGTRFRRLVAVITTRGEACFAIHPERDAPASTAWDVRPGDLVLIRGPGLAGSADGRPLHSVGPPAPSSGTRWSIGLRMRAG
jgi:hypothetical protein